MNKAKRVEFDGNEDNGQQHKFTAKTLTTLKKVMMEWLRRNAS